MKRNLLALLLVCLTYILQAAAVWVPRASLPGQGLYEPATFTLNNLVYVVAGGTPVGNTNAVWAYDCVQDIWTQKANYAGGAAEAPRGFSLNGYGYVLTGKQGAYLSSMYRYDAASNSWLIQAPFPGTPRYTAVAITIGNLAYFGTGYDPLQNDWWSFDPATNTWTQRASVPGNPRQSAVGFSINGRGYVGLGSYTQHPQYTPQNDFYEYNPATNSWIPRSPFPASGRWSCMNFVYGNEGYVGCGISYLSSPGATTIYNQIYKYNPASDSWSLFGNFPNNRYGGVAAVVNNRIFGGLGYNGASYQSSWYEYTVVPCSLDVSISKTNTTCNNSCDGTASATVINGSGNYTYLWSNGQTTASISNLCPGVYTVYVRDSLTNCPDSANVIISAGGSFSFSNITVNDTSCTPGQCSGSITLIPDTFTTSAYSYLWSTGATSHQLTNLCAGNYSVTITSLNNCTLSATYSVADSSDCDTLPCNLGATIAKVNPTCKGDCDGSMTANITGGSGNYSYIWSNGATSSSIQQLCAGTYTVTVTDLNSQCVVTVSQSIAKGPVGANAIRQNATCGQCNGSITITGNGGNGAPYTYLWSNGATTSTVDSLCPGVYTTTITDKSGCTFICTNTLINVDTGCTVNCVNDFTTYTQGGWGNPGAPGQYMAANFASCSGGSVTIGDPCGYTITLNSVQAVRDFLPQGGTPAALTQNYVNLSSHITVLAGQLLSVHFAIMFDACDSNLSASNSPLKDQVYVVQNSPFYGWNIQAIHDTAMKILAGCSSAYSPSQINGALTDINENYDGGQNHGKFECPASATVSSVSTVSAEKRMSVFPNPFNNSFTLDTKGESGLNVIVRDITGKVLASYENVSDKLKIESDFEAGIYFVVIDNPVNGTREIIHIVSVK